MSSAGGDSFLILTFAGRDSFLILTSATGDWGYFLILTYVCSWRHLFILTSAAGDSSLILTSVAA
jgi:hypothetical protein